MFDLLEWITSWRVDPEEPRPSRPSDCYDIIGEDTYPISLANLSHADATQLLAWIRKGAGL